MHMNLQRVIAIPLVRSCVSIGVGLPYLIALLLVCHSTNGYAAAAFTPLGFIGDITGLAVDVSGDGSVVVGRSGSQAFYWTSEGSMVRATSFLDSPSVSADGSVVVGRYMDQNFFSHAYRWTIGGTFELLEDLPGGRFDSGAFDASADGSVVVGYGTPSFPDQAFPVVWEDNAPPHRLSDLGSGSALGVSADGTVIVGRVGSPQRAFRRVPGSITLLENLSGATGATAQRVSADGSVVVGVNFFRTVPPDAASFHSEAFRWTELDGTVSLGDLPGGRIFSTAYDVSANGSVIVGSGETSFENGVGISEAFYWTSATGMLNLRDVLISSGATGLDGWTLIEARGVSWDGVTVVGSGIDPTGATQAFVATIPEPSTIMLGIIAALGLLAFYVLRFWRCRTSRKH
jgi:uncharacterized membrane protein